MKEINEIKFGENAEKTFEIDLSKEKMWQDFYGPFKDTPTSIDCPDIIKSSILNTKSKTLKVTLQKITPTGTHFAKLSVDLEKGSTNKETKRYSINLKMKYINGEQPVFGNSKEDSLKVEYVVNYTPEDYLKNLKEKDNGDTLVTKKGLILNLKEFARQLKLVRSIGIRYDLNGGQWENGNEGRTSIVEGHSYISPEPVKMGYTFLGWKNFPVDHIPSDEERKENGEVNPTKQTILSGSSGSKLALAIWKPVNYKITYKWGTPNMEEGDSFNPTYFGQGNNKLSLIDVPNNVGYVSTDSWTITGPNKEVYTNVKDISGDEIYKLTQVPSNKINDSVTINIIAEVKPREYSITYNMAEDEEVDNNSGTHKFHYEDTLTLPIPRKVGYKFMGWTITQKGNTLSESKIFTLTSNDLKDAASDEITLNPTWEKIKYKVILDPAGGIVGSTYTNDLILDGENLSGIQLPIASTESIQITRKGYTFTEWSLVDSSDGSIDRNSKFTPKANLDHDVLIEANWVAKKVNLFYSVYKRENSTTGYTSDSTQSKTLNVGDKVQFVKEGQNYELKVNGNNTDTTIPSNGDLDNVSEVLGTVSNPKSFIIEDDTTVDLYFTLKKYESAPSYTLQHKSNDYVLLEEKRYVNAFGDRVYLPVSELLLSKGFTVSNPELLNVSISDNSTKTIDYNKKPVNLTIKGNGLIRDSSSTSNCGSKLTLIPLIDTNKCKIGQYSYTYDKDYCRLYNNSFKFKVSGYFSTVTSAKYSLEYNTADITGNQNIIIFGDTTIEVLPQNDKIVNVIYHHPDWYNEVGDWTTYTESDISILPNKPIQLHKIEKPGYIQNGFAIYNGMDLTIENPEKNPSEWGDDHSGDDDRKTKNLYCKAYDRTNTINLSDIKSKTNFANDRKINVHVFGFYTLSDEVDAYSILESLDVWDLYSETYYIMFKKGASNYLSYSYLTGSKSNIFEKNNIKIGDKHRPVATDVLKDDYVFITPYRVFKPSPNVEIGKVCQKTLRVKVEIVPKRSVKFTFAGEYYNPPIDFPE